VAGHLPTRQLRLAYPPWAENGLRPSYSGNPYVNANGPGLMKARNVLLGAAGSAYRWSYVGQTPPAAMAWAGQLASPISAPPSLDESPRRRWVDPSSRRV